MEVFLTRSEIASCIEASYDRLGVAAAMRKLFFDSERAMKNYANERSWKLETTSAHGPVNILAKTTVRIYGAMSVIIHPPIFG